MKRYMAAVFAALTIVGLSACGNSDASERAVYGETVIPDVPCGNADFEGKAEVEFMAESDKQRCLDCMVFETHTFGEYTLSLVGDQVRTDEADFPGSIYAQNLRVEMEKGGVKTEDSGEYNDTVLYVWQYMTEYRLFADKIGSYLDVYDLQYPVIAMRYYFQEDPGRTVTKAVEFSTIQDGQICSGFAGSFEQGIGVMLNPDGAGTSGTVDLLTVNSESGGVGRMGIFDSDEFIVADDKTLEDAEAGIRYRFRFSDPPEFELYAGEWMK